MARLVARLCRQRADSVQLGAEKARRIVGQELPVTSEVLHRRPASPPGSFWTTAAYNGPDVPPPNNQRTLSRCSVGGARLPIGLCADKGRRAVRPCEGDWAAVHLFLLGHGWNGGGDSGASDGRNC